MKISLWCFFHDKLLVIRGNMTTYIATHFHSSHKDSRTYTEIVRFMSVDTNYDGDP